MAARITEILANPAGTDRGLEWVELCADAATELSGYALQVGTRKLALSGSLEAGACKVARTGTASVRNREAEVSLIYKGAAIQSVRTAGTAPEGFGFHVTEDATFWATSTPGVATGTPPALPPLPDLAPPSILPGLLGTALCTAGILTATALFALRHARDRHHAREGGDPAARR